MNLFIHKLSSQSPTKQDDEEVEQVRMECTEAFSSRDYIMEPGIISSLKR